MNKEYTLQGKVVLCIVAAKSTIAMDKIWAGKQRETADLRLSSVSFHAVLQSA
jgi:hypothetical protein